MLLIIFKIIDKTREYCDFYNFLNILNIKYLLLF